jgi:hypothetical protein
MNEYYAALALSYREWQYRVTPSGWEHMDPAVGLAALQVANVFSLLMLLPTRAVPSWLFAFVPVLYGVALAWHNSRLYRINPVPVAYAQLADAVPKLREFPLVYAYLFLTLALFAGSLYLAVQSAA